MYLQSFMFLFTNNTNKSTEQTDLDLDLDFLIKPTDSDCIRLGVEKTKSYEVIN